MPPPNSYTEVLTPALYNATLFGIGSLQIQVVKMRAGSRVGPNAATVVLMGKDNVKAGEGLGWVLTGPRGPSSGLHGREVVFVTAPTADSQARNPVGVGSWACGHEHTVGRVPRCACVHTRSPMIQRLIGSPGTNTMANDALGCPVSYSTDGTAPSPYRPLAGTRLHTKSASSGFLPDSHFCPPGVWVELGEKGGWKPLAQDGSGVRRGHPRASGPRLLPPSEPIRSGHG